MYTFVLPLLMGMPQGSAEGGTGGHPMMTFVPFVAIIAIFYFLIIRPQNKKRKETENMLKALRKGDRVVTIGGLHGTIQTVKETSGTVIVKVDDNVKLEFSRSAISSVQAVAREEKEDKIEEKKDDSSDTGE